MSTELTVPQQVEKALAFTETRAQVMALVEESTHITAITNPAGYQQCHAARMSLKNTRIAIQKTGKDARDDAVKFQKAVIEKEKELVALIEPEEKRLAELQDAVDKAKEREKAAKEEAERQAQEAIRARFDAIKALPLSAVGCTVQQIRALQDRAELLSGDFVDPTHVAAFNFERGIAIAALRAAEDRQLQADAESARVAAEREELAKLRAEQEAVRREGERLAQLERDRNAAEEARLAAIERGRVMAENAAITERLAAERVEAERLGNIAREAARIAREEEQARIEAERAEARRIADAKLEADREKLRKEQAKLAEDKRKAREAAIKNADLHATAREAVSLLQELGQGEHLVTLKLASALGREPKRKAA